MDARTRTFVLMRFVGIFCDLGSSNGVRGSHHVFRKTGVRELINLQRDGSHAKPYQVRQVRRVLLRYDLGEVE